MAVHAAIVDHEAMIDISEAQNINYNTLMRLVRNVRSDHGHLEKIAQKESLKEAALKAVHKYVKKTLESEKPLLNVDEVLEHVQ